MSRCRHSAPLPTVRSLLCMQLHCGGTQAAAEGQINHRLPQVESRLRSRLSRESQGKERLKVALLEFTGEWKSIQFSVSVMVFIRVTKRVGNLIYMLPYSVLKRWEREAQFAIERGNGICFPVDLRGSAGAKLSPITSSARPSTSRQSLKHNSSKFASERFIL